MESSRLKINRIIKDKVVTFANVPVGDFFTFSGELFIKIGPLTVFGLEDNQVTNWVNEQAEVNHHETILTIKP